MPKTMRKTSLKIQMLAGNSLNVCPDSDSQKKLRLELPRTQKPNSVNQSITNSRIVEEKSSRLDQGYSAYKGFRIGKKCYAVSEKSYQKGDFLGYSLLYH